MTAAYPVTSTVELLEGIMVHFSRKPLARSTRTAGEWHNVFIEPPQVRKFLDPSPREPLELSDAAPVHCTIYIRGGITIRDIYDVTAAVVESSELYEPFDWMAYTYHDGFTWAECSVVTIQKDEAYRCRRPEWEMKWDRYMRMKYGFQDLVSEDDVE
ncbi:uncharacterized protein LTR77_003525 [Saxophila tyrrhenica]|uniref:Uncharacterized protein n=1 Tax=Saxophila tyrrhenica TaxID=1690608 RepID=A0AAV9PE11_9PEZI|nr:hypothetical protein LTR77_003525 [Saxophila tyrrhenica]